MGEGDNNNLFTLTFLILHFSCKPTDKEFRFDCQLEANEGTWKPAEAYADTSG